MSDEHDNEVWSLARALLDKERFAYETIRRNMIELHGYDKFRDLQCRAFEVALFGHEVPR